MLAQYDASASGITPDVTHIEAIMLQLQGHCLPVSPILATTLIRCVPAP